MPKSILGCTCDLGAGVTGQQTDYSQNTKVTIAIQLAAVDCGAAANLEYQKIRGRARAIPARTCELFAALTATASDGALGQMSLPPQAMETPERTRKEMGPITMNFEVLRLLHQSWSLQCVLSWQVPMFNASGLNIRFLKVSLLRSLYSWLIRLLCRLPRGPNHTTLTVGCAMLLDHPRMCAACSQGLLVSTNKLLLVLLHVIQARLRYVTCICTRAI